MQRRVRRPKRPPSPSAPPVVQIHFGRTVRSYREQRGWSQTHLAGMLHYEDAAMISLIERGLRAPSLWKAMQLALCFDTTVEALCGIAMPLAVPGYQAG